MTVWYIILLCSEQRGPAWYCRSYKPSYGTVGRTFPVRDIKSRRIFTDLNRGWKTWLTESTQTNQPYVKLHHPVTVNLPHNWDDYYGYRQLTHGNLHGTALYTRSFEVRKQEGRRYFLQFEGIGTYATIALNGKALVGSR